MDLKCFQAHFRTANMEKMAARNFFYKDALRDCRFRCRAQAILVTFPSRHFLIYTLLFRLQTMDC